MSDIDDLQRRISAAMDRVAQGVENISKTPAGPDPEMVQALEDERTANAQLNERIKTLKSRSDAELAAAKAALDESRSRMAQLDLDLQRLRQANRQLQDACAALVDANKEGVGEPHLINRALMAELESLRASRAADVAETGAILAALTPLLDAAGDANQGEGA